jgi:hypothetical protein
MMFLTKKMFLSVYRKKDFHGSAAFRQNAGVAAAA